MPESSMDHLVQRINRLEKQNRQIKRMGFLTGLILLVALVVAQKPQDTSSTLEVSSFRLVTSDGTLRAELGLEQNDNPFLKFYDKRGDELTSLELDSEKNPRLTFRTKTGKPFLELGADHYESPYISLSDTSGKPRARLNLGSNESPAFALFDSTGKARIQLNIQNNQVPQLSLHDRYGEIRSRLSVENGVTPELHFYDRFGRPRLQLISNDSDQLTQLVFYDDLSGPSIELGMLKDDFLGLSIKDRLRFQRSLLGTTSYGNTGFLLCDQEGNTRINLTASKDSYSGIMVKDELGNNIDGLPKN